MRISISLFIYKKSTCPLCEDRCFFVFDSRKPVLSEEPVSLVYKKLFRLVYINDGFEHSVNTTVCLSSFSSLVGCNRFRVAVSLC